jgi:hypothetical protein
MRSAAVAARDARTSRDDLIRRRRYWRLFVIDRPKRVTGRGASLAAPAMWREAERLVS